MSVYRILLLFVAAFLLPGTLPMTARGQAPSGRPSVLASDPIGLTLGATAQVRASFAHDNPSSASRVGFGIRRLRLRLKTTVGDRLSFSVQGEGANADFKILDLAVEYRLSSALRVRAGRIISAQPAGAALTSHTKIDAIDRPVSAGEWSKRTLGADGRDFGIEARLDLTRWHFRAFVHNGDGDWGRARGNFREEVGLGDATQGIHRTGLAATLAATYQPVFAADLEVGGFVGANASRNANTAYEDIGRSYATYGAHLYWGALPGSRPFRLKADLMGLRYETLAAALREASLPYEQHLRGLSLLAAGRVFRAGEVFARYEHFDPNIHAANADYAFVTLGASFSPSALRGDAYHKERLTLAWTTRLDHATNAPAYGLVLQAQLVF